MPPADEGLRVAALSVGIMAWTSWAGWPRAALRLSASGVGRTKQAALLARVAALCLPVVEVQLAAATPTAAEATLLARLCDLGLTTVCRLAALSALSGVDRRVVRVVSATVAAGREAPEGWSAIAAGDEILLAVDGDASYASLRGLLRARPVDAGAVVWLTGPAGAPLAAALAARALGDRLPLRLAGAPPRLTGAQDRSGRRSSPCSRL